MLSITRLSGTLCSYEKERPVRVKTIHLKGVDNATYEDRERYLYRPTFKPLWCNQVCAKAFNFLFFNRCISAELSFNRSHRLT